MEQISTDLNDAEQRRALFSKVGSSRALMITEGLLMYLPGATVEALAVEAAQLSGIRYWLTDVQTPAFARMIGMDTFKSIQNVRDSESLDGLEIYGRCIEAGWRPVRQYRYVVDVVTAVPERVKELRHCGKRVWPGSRLRRRLDRRLLRMTSLGCICSGTV